MNLLVVQASTIDMNALKNISRIQIRPETLIILLDLYESKGKTFYYNELFKKDVEAFQNLTIEKDLFNLENLFNFNLTDARIKFIAKNNFSAKNKDEQFVGNMKNILNRIQDNHDQFELIVNEIHNLAKLLTNEHTVINWNKQTVLESEGLLEKNKSISTRELLDELNKEYISLTKKHQFEQVTLITNYYVDFINMEIFDNYNKEVAMFLLYTMIFELFPIYKYVSFFKYFAKHYQGWQYALEQASYNWDSQFPQTDNLTQIIYNIILESYEEVNDLARQYEFEKNLNKSDNIENTILKQKQLFSKNDLRKLHPTVSDSTIDRTLQRLRDEGKIMPIGAGRSSRWQVLVENKSFSQLDLFD